MKVALVLLLPLALLGCGGSAAPTPAPVTPKPEGYVSRALLGDDWPLTVADGVVRCEAGSAVVFRTGGVDYSVNGAADTIASDRGWKDIRPIWADDPSGVSPKLSIGPLIDRGLALC